MTLAQKKEMEDLYTTYSYRIDRDNPDGNVTTNCFLFGLEQAVAILGYRFECVYEKIKGTEFRTYRLVREQWE